MLLTSIIQYTFSQCISDSIKPYGKYGCITIGKVYTAINVDLRDILIVNDGDIEFYYEIELFKSVEDIRNERLNELGIC